jgi:hypothetical protein
MVSMGLSRGEPHVFQKLNDSSDKVTNWLLFWKKICREFLFSDGQFRKCCERIKKKKEGEKES